MPQWTHLMVGGTIRCAIDDCGFPHPLWITTIYCQCDEPMYYHEPHAWYLELWWRVRECVRWIPYRVALWRWDRRHPKPWQYRERP